MLNSNNHHHFCIHSDILTTIWVNAGNSAPNELNKSANTGTTLTNKIMVTIIATTITAIGYFKAFLIFAFSSSLFSLYVATRSSIVSSAPDCSPASTNEQNRSSKYLGCLRSAAAKVLPDSTSDLTLSTNSFIEGLSSASATISNDCVSGTPAFIIVANCRTKIAISIALMLFFI